jgi:hypothetical protein
MKSQQRRDQEAITIFAGLLLFALVNAVGAIAIVLAHQLAGLEGAAVDVSFYVIVGCGVAASVYYIYRHRGP